MWQELVLVHREASVRPDPLQGPGQLWQTCLRQLLFVEPGSVPLDFGDAQIRSGVKAHRLLVEICSGLHSPLFGETEVFGQFREFREKENIDPRWNALLDAVEEDVRKLRRNLLTDIGSQSYGSLARRHLPASGKVVLLGAGRLALDLLPWLSGRDVTVVARNTEKAESLLPANTPTLPLASLGNSKLPDIENAHWLVAAPLSDAELLALWEKNPAGTVLDFRGGECTLPARANYIGLHALFQELAAAKESHELKRSEALLFSAELSKRREQSVVHRPFGWEDAFA